MLLNVFVAVVTAAIGFFSSLWVWDQATSLMRQQSDAAVAVGLMILVLLLAAWLYIVLKFVVPWVRRLANPRQIGSAVALAVLASLSLGACSKVDPAHVGIEVDYYGKRRGVQDLPVVTGMVWYNPFTTSIFQYPTFVQTAVWTRSPHEGSPDNEEISYNSVDGVTFTADISLSYQVVSEKVPHFYVKFRSDDLNAFTHGFLRNIARDAFNEVAQQYTMDDLYGAKKEEMLTKVRELVNKQTTEFGIAIVQFGYISAPRPPESVSLAINAKVKAIQDAIAAENKVRGIKAEAEQAVARAEGESRANLALNASLTPNLIEWRRLGLTEMAIAKWDGRRPMVEGTSSGLLLNVTPQQQVVAPPAK